MLMFSYTKVNARHLKVQSWRDPENLMLVISHCFPRHELEYSLNRETDVNMLAQMTKIEQHLPQRLLAVSDCLSVGCVHAFHQEQRGKTAQEKRDFVVAGWVKPLGWPEVRSCAVLFVYAATSFRDTTFDSPTPPQVKATSVVPHLNTKRTKFETEAFTT